MPTGFWTLLTSLRQKGEEPEAQEPMPEDTRRSTTGGGGCQRGMWTHPEPTKILDFLNTGVPNSRRRKCYANVRNHLPTELWVPRWIVVCFGQKWLQKAISSHCLFFSLPGLSYPLKTNGFQVPYVVFGGENLETSKYFFPAPGIQKELVT